MAEREETQATDTLVSVMSIAEYPPTGEDIQKPRSRNLDIPPRGGTFCDQCRDCLDGKQAWSRQLASIKQATGNAQHANQAARQQGPLMTPKPAPEKKKT